MSSYQNPDGSFLNETHGGPVKVVSPGTIAAETVNLKWNERDLYIANTGTTLATLNVGLPMLPEAGSKVEIGVGANVGTLAVKDGFGNTVTTAPTSISAGSSVVMRYVSKAIGWVKWK